MGKKAREGCRKVSPVENRKPQSQEGIIQSVMTEAGAPAVENKVGENLVERVLES